MAAIDITYKTPGMEYVREALIKVGQFQGSNAIKEAWKVGGRYLMQKGRQSLSEKNNKLTGNLYKSLTYKVNKANTGIHIGFFKGGHHAHLVDRGHALVVGTQRKRTGKRTKASLFWTEVRESDTQPAGKMIGQRILEAYGEYLTSLGNKCPDFSNKYY